MWVDYHSHILPEMDDGSISADMSADMIFRLTGQGARAIALTSHFYAEEESVASFLSRREEAFSRLMAHERAEEFPPLALGAEVRLREGMCAMDDLPRLCLQGTSCLLLELPYKKYHRRMLQEIENIAYRLHVTPMLAHVDRYLAWGLISEEDWEELVTFPDAIVQVNAEAFAARNMRRHLTKLFRLGCPVVFGSDAHNVTDRAPNGDLIPDSVWKKYPPPDIL